MTGALSSERSSVDKGDLRFKMRGLSFLRDCDK